MGKLYRVLPRTILFKLTAATEIKELLCTPGDACKGGRCTVTGNYPCSSKKENVGSQGEAVPALTCWRSLGAVEILASVQALKPFNPSRALLTAAAVVAAGPSPRLGQDLCSFSSGCCSCG